MSEPKRIPSLVAARATFSHDRAYRYALWRTWDEALPQMIFVGLNPSTADEKLDDPTIRRCLGFAKREGCGQLVMLNLFALRSTRPDVMRAHADPVGPENDGVLTDMTQDDSGIWVAAWGVHGSHRERDNDVLRLLATRGVKLHCLGVTKDGAPRHPLYLPGNAALLPYPAPTPHQEPQ